MPRATEATAENLSSYLMGNHSKIDEEVLQILNKYSGKTLTNTDNGSKMLMDNKEVRKQYIDEVSRIKENIDKSLPLEEQAKQACEARNAIRKKAREQMADVELKKKLDKDKPSKTFEERILDKMKRKKMTREEAIQDIYDTATKTNADVDKELGLGGE